MPSNLDILAANDFTRAFSCWAQTVKRRPHGDATKIENVEAVVEIDSVTAQSTNSSDGGLEQNERSNQTRQGARIEVAADQETFSDDAWEIDGSVWATVGAPQGSDAGTKTIVLRRLSRITGRWPNVNTQA